MQYKLCAVLIMWSFPISIFAKLCQVIKIQEVFFIKKHKVMNNEKIEKASNN